MDHSSKCQQVFKMLVEVFSSYYSSELLGSSSQAPATGTRCFYTNIHSGASSSPYRFSYWGRRMRMLRLQRMGTHSGRDQFQHTTYDYSKAKMTAQDILRLAEKIINECPEVFNLAANFLDSSCRSRPGA